MDFLDAWWSRKAAVPEWASFMTSSDYDHFLQLVQAELKRRGLHGNESLPQLAQECRALPRDQWAAGIARYLDIPVEVPTTAQALAACAHDYRRVASLLRVRIYAPGWNKGPPDTVVREDLPGLETVLCFDLPTMLVPVRGQDAARWNVGLDAAFSRGIANSTAHQGITQEAVKVLPGMTVTAYMAEPVWHTTNVLDLERLVGRTGPYGALVALPHRHMLLVHRIGDGQVPALIVSMGRMAHGLHQEGPGSISPDLYWFIDGTFEHAPVTMTPQGIHVAMPVPQFNDRVMRPLGFLA